MSFFFRSGGQLARAIAGGALCGSLLMAGQAAPAPTSTGGPYRIAGVLVNAATGEAVRRGTVQALDEGGRAVASCLTDNDGGFALNHLAAGKYQLSASKRGFRVQAYDEHDEFATSIVTGPDQDTTHLNFKLIPNAVLYGTVTDDNGDPVQGARMMLFQRPKHPGLGERTMNVNGTVTDETGAYEIGNIAEGEYMLAVVAEPWYAIHDGAAAKRNSALDVAFPVTYFDSTTEEQAATPIELTGGMRQEANIILHAVPALHISIGAQRRLDANSGGEELQQVVFGTPVGGATSSTYSPDSGILTMDGVAPGHYQLVQHGDSDRVVDLSLSASQQVDAGPAGTANAVAGRVRMFSGAAVPDQMTISLERIDDGPGQTQYAAEAREGRFRFDSVSPGEYRVWATSGDRSMPVVAIGAGAQVPAGNLFTVRERSPELVVVASDAEMRVEGFAKKDGKGFAGAMMVLLPKNPAQWKALTRRDQSDSDGSFAFRDVTPGEYTVVAIEDGWPLDWTSAATMARYLPAGTNVTITANSVNAVRLASPVTVQQR